MATPPDEPVGTGAIGAFTALTGSIAAMTGVRGATPLDESLRNVGIDVGAMLLSGVLYTLDKKSQVGWG
jgi:hypothetical protein